MRKQEAKKDFTDPPNMHPAMFLKLAKVLGVVPAELGGAKVEKIGYESGSPGSIPMEVVAAVREIEKRPPSDSWRGKPPPGTRIKPIPGGNEIAAGDPRKMIALPDSFHEGAEFLPGELWPHDALAFWVRVGGDSMEPKFRKGDRVVGSPQLADQLESGDVVCIRFKDESRFRGGRTLKRIFWLSDDRYELRSDNPEYPPLQIFPTEIDWIGPVVVHIRYPGEGFDVSGTNPRQRIPKFMLHKSEDAPQGHPDYENESQDATPNDVPTANSLPPGVHQEIGEVLEKALDSSKGGQPPKPRSGRRGRGAKSGR